MRRRDVPGLAVVLTRVSMVLQPGVLPDEDKQWTLCLLELADACLVVSFLLRKFLNF